VMIKAFKNEKFLKDFIFYINASLIFPVGFL